MQKKLFLSLIGASSAHAEASRQVFSAMGLTEGQPKILYVLYRKDGCIQKDLAEVCRIRQSTLTVLLEKMEKQNLIYRESCYVSGKKRAYKVFMTENGREKAEYLESQVEILEEKGFAGFSKDERNCLLQLLTRVEENMRK